MWIRQQRYHWNCQKIRFKHSSNSANKVISECAFVSPKIPCLDPNQQQLWLCAKTFWLPACSSLLDARCFLLHLQKLLTNLQFCDQALQQMLTVVRMLLSHMIYILFFFFFVDTPPFSLYMRETPKSPSHSMQKHNSALRITAVTIQKGFEAMWWYCCVGKNVAKAPTQISRRIISTQSYLLNHACTFLFEQRASSCTLKSVSSCHHRSCIALHSDGSLRLHVFWCSCHIRVLLLILWLIHCSGRLISSSACPHIFIYTAWLASYFAEISFCGAQLIILISSVCNGRFHPLLVRLFKKKQKQKNFKIH